MSVAQTARRNISFGGRMPPLVGALIIATIVLSLVGAVGGRYGFPLATYGVLAPQAVFQGQVWRLLTWVFFQGDPIGLVFGCLMLYWFGRDLAGAWGERWFAGAFFGGAAVTGVLLSLVARLVWPELMYSGFAGNMAITAGLVIVWALAFPDRQIRLYFLFPMAGMTLVWIELGLTALFALYYGLAMVLPVVIGQALALGYMYRGRLFGRLGALLPKRRPPRKPPTSFQVWDEKKQQFRPPKWMN